MKIRLTILLFLGLGLHTTFSAEAQTAAGPVASEVVGFAAFDVPGASQAGTPQLSMKGIGLIRSIEYQGTAEAIRGKTLTDKQAVWTNNQFNPPKATLATATHYLEITSGPMAGALFDIVQTDAAHHTLTVAQVLPAKIGSNAGFRVRMHWTLASLLGVANQAGLQSGDEATADLVSIYNGKRYDNFYYSNGAAGNGWRRVGGGNVDMSGRQIIPTTVWRSRAAPPLP